MARIKYFNQTTQQWEYADKAGISHTHGDLYYAKSEIDSLLAEKADKDFVVTVDSNNIADKTWAEVYEAREAGARIVLNRLGFIYEYAEEGYDYSLFTRYSGNGIYEAKLYDWTQEVSFSDESIVDLSNYYTKSETDASLATKSQVQFITWEADD